MTRIDADINEWRVILSKLPHPIPPRGERKELHDLLDTALDGLMAAVPAEAPGPGRIADAE